MTLILSLKTAWTRRHEITLGLLIICLLVIYCLLVVIKGKNAVIAARPEIESSTETRTVKAPTVTKEKERRTFRPPTDNCPPIEIIEIEREISAGGEETVASTHVKETPAQAPARPSRTRYAGVGVDPLDYARLPRLRGGVAFLERLDVGLAYDARRPLTGGAVQIEATWRF